MAPEQLAGGTLTPQSDVYALGLVLFELFTGERVHKENRLVGTTGTKGTTSKTGTTGKTGTTAVPLDPAIARVIDRCLDPDPKKRPASALAAGETPSPQLVAAAGGEGTLPSKIGVPLLVAFLVLVGVGGLFNHSRL